MARRFMVTLAAVVVIAGLGWAATTLVSTETTTVGVKIVRKVRR